MAKTALEKELRLVLRDESKFPSGAVTFTEFGLGGDAGVPDCWFAKGRRWNPLELKKGKSVLKGLRPSQRRWHRESLLFDIQSFGATLHNGDVLLYEIMLVDRQLTERAIGGCLLEEFNIEILMNSCVLV